MREHGVLVSFAGIAPGVIDMFRRSSLDETLTDERMFFNLEMAVRKLAPVADTEQSP